MLKGGCWGGGVSHCAHPPPHDQPLLVAGGPDELAEKFSTTSIMYGLCRLQDAATGTHRIVLINWVSAGLGQGWAGGEALSSLPLQLGSPGDRDVALGASLSGICRRQVGEKAPESQREACAGHLPTIRAFFRVSLWGAWGSVPSPPPPLWGGGGLGTGSRATSCPPPIPASPDLCLLRRVHSWLC